MNEIEIKQEPIDYDDVLVSNEVQQQQMQHEEIKDINTVSIKEELVDSLTDEQFNNFQILNEEADIITLAPTADKSEDELNFIQLFDIFGGNNKKRKLAENSTTCINPKQIRQREYDFDDFAANHVDVMIKCEPNLSYEENMPCLPTIPDIKQEIDDDDLSAACQTNSNREYNKILHDVRIKDEPVDYDEAIQLNRKAARIGGNGGETPIPKIKIPANLFNSLKNASSTNLYTANIESYKNNFKPNFVPTTTNTLDIKKLIPSSSTVTTTITKIHNNILQPIKYSNNAFVLKAPLNTPQTTTTNSNIKILKLPPNTKIIKLDSKQSLNNKNTIITASTPITSIQIKQGENSTPTFLVTSTSPTILKSSQSPAQTQPTTKLLGETPSEQQLKDRIIAEQKKQKSIHFVSKPALDFIENLPESRKAINELLQQVKKAETSNPLTPNFTTVIKKKPSASVTGKTQIETKDIKPVNKAISKCIKVELSETKIKHEPTDDIEVKYNVDESNDSNSSMHPTMLDNVVRVVQMRLKGDDAVLLKARRENINNRCFWLCPRCPRQYAQRTTMRQHLENHHALTDAELDALTLEVRIIRIGNDNVKVDLSAINEMSNIPNDERIEESIPEMTGNGDEAGNNKSRKRESNKYKCDKCGRSCSSKVTLIDHIVANCSREPQYQCSQCPKKFYSVSTLNCHVTIHTGELPHKCNYCEKRFRTRGQVTVHHRTHTGERPFKCQVCSQCFTHRETLIAHLSRHIGMKRYKCYGCNKLFSCISGLRTHRETRPDSCGRVKFNPRALGPRVRVVKGNVIFEPQPEINPYLRSEEPPAVTDS